MSEIIEKINDYFKASNLTKKEFGKQVGVSEVTIHNILNGKQSIKVEVLEKISEVLGIKTSYFFLNDKEITVLNEYHQDSASIEEMHSMIALMRFTNIEVVKKYIINAKEDKVLVVLLKLFRDLEEAGFFIEENTFIGDNLHERLKAYTDFDLDNMPNEKKVNKKIIDWINANLIEKDEQKIYINDISGNKPSKNIELYRKHSGNIPRSLKRERLIAIGKDNTILGELIFKVKSENEIFEEIYKIGYLDYLLRKEYHSQEHGIGDFYNRPLRVK